MHEVSLMEETVAIAIAQAQAQQSERIHQFQMRIGEISGVVPEALRFAFDIVTQDTIAAGATLTIETVSIVCHCSRCNTDFHPVDLYIYHCPDCGQLSHQIKTGREIELVALEVS
jgi:hydrogenase nickel incorporation protein HypA/HybF